MKNKTMRKAMITSIIALVVCFAMLVGTTYAWFTDSVTAGNNVIKSGTLDIDLEVKRGADYVSIETDNSPIFDYQLWEPGYTEWANVRVVNNGNLALKYTMRIIANGTVSALADVIDVYYAASEVVKPNDRDLTGLRNIGTLAQAISANIVIDDNMLPNEADYATIVLHMQETAGNEYQNLEIGSSFSFQILATQYTAETDSFDDQYDALAAFPDMAAIATDITTALANNENVVLYDNVVATSAANTGAFNVSGETFDGNGKTLNVPLNDTKNNYGITTSGGTIKNLTIVGSRRSIFIQNATEDVVLENVTLGGTGTAYPINTGSGNSASAKLIVKDSTLIGWTSFDGIGSAEFKNVNFVVGDTYTNPDDDPSWNRTLRPYVNTVLEGCDFSDASFILDTTKLRDGNTITLKNCTVGGTLITSLTQIATDGDLTNVSIVND